VNVILEGREPCPVCGWQATWILSTGVRVNKTSIRSTGTSIGARLDHFCPECGMSLGSDMGPRVWRFDGRSREAVDEYRANRGWL
jgi:hypothetical protein